MKNFWASVTADESPMRFYLSEPEGSGPDPAIVMIQNQDSVGDFTQEMTRSIAQAGTSPSRLNSIIARVSRRPRKKSPITRTTDGTSTCSAISKRL